MKLLLYVVVACCCVVTTCFSGNDLIIPEPPGKPRLRTFDSMEEPNFGYALARYWLMIEELKDKCDLLEGEITPELNEILNDIRNGDEPPGFVRPIPPPPEDPFWDDIE